MNEENEQSLSLRRAWIEIRISGKSTVTKESLSLRRAWIEIQPALGAKPEHQVALLTESVD